MLFALSFVAGCTGGARARDRTERADFHVREDAAPRSSSPSPPSSAVAPRVTPPEDPAVRAARRERVVAELAGHAPHAWGQTIEGVLTEFDADAPSIALTLDACGGPGGNGYDEALIDLLRAEHVPATLFVTARWIAANGDAARSLADDPLFEIENHGDRHRPCSVNGRSAYAIRGTRSVSDAIDEISEGETAIEALTGRRPLLFRPGTAYFDDVCVDVIEGLGARPMGFSVVGDAGGGFGRKEVARQIATAPSGSVVLVHMNKPGGSTAEGVADALPKVRARGLSFVRLDQVRLR